MIGKPRQGESGKRFLTRLGVALLVGFTTFWAGEAYAADSAKRVLIFSSADVNTPAITTLNRSIRSKFQQTSSTRIQFYNEALDSLRIPNEKYETEMLRLLQRKYEGEQIDLIICLAVDALKFLLKHENDVFAGVPKVFVAHDRRELSGLALNDNVAGVVGKTELRPVIEDALRFQPDTRRVVVIAGNSVLDKFWLEAARADFQQYQSRLEFSYLTDSTIDELKPQLAALPPHTIVFFVSFTLDRNRVSYTAPEAAGLVASSSNAPVYAPVETQLGQGIIGGHLFSYEALGNRAAEMAVRILNGEKPSALGVQTVESVPMFDWRELRRWGLSEGILPPGSRVLFKDPTFWELYKWRIVGTLALLILQTLFIAALLVERKRRRRARESLDRLNVELEQRVVDRTAALDGKSRELEAFAYSVAHDLKAPLRGIDGYSRLLLEDYAEVLPKEGRKFVQTICTATTEMSELIEDLLEYSRLERREIRHDQIEIQPFIRSLVEQQKRETAGRDIEFVVKVNGSHVLADSIGLAQALKNYLDNAIKFTSKCQHAKIEVGSEETPRGCLLWVRDNGLGFDMKYQDSIFGIFQRLNSSEEYPGTGIGLAIVRKAMERMGGRAWATSAPGEGSTFYLEIAKA